MIKTRIDAISLLKEYTQSESLIKHALAVEAAMRWYAKSRNLSDSETEVWGMTGLLHDFDYEKFPTPDNSGHPFRGNQILTELGYPEDLRTAIMGHATYTGVARESILAKTLFACDELCGLVTASVLVRPDRSLMSLEPPSVLKKMKDKAFARGCSREDIQLGSQEIGIDLPTHIGNVIAAMREIAPDLGLR